MPVSRRSAVVQVVVILFATGWGAASAQQDASYPSKPIRILVPYAARGLPDTVARTVGRRMEELVGKPVLIDNRPGASGGIAVNALAASPADGHTLLVTEGSILYNAVLFAKLPYNPEDLLPAVQLARAPMFLVVNQKVPVSSMREFMEYVKARPGQLNYGSAGLGSPHHLTMEAMKTGLRLNLVHVAYKGSGEAVPALLGGHIEVMFSAYPSIAGFVKEKRLTILATNNPEPFSQVPDVPPVANFIPGFDYASIVGIFAPKGTPKQVLEKLADSAITATKDSEVTRLLHAAGVEPAGAGALEFARALRSERERVAKAAADANIKLQ